MTKSKSFMQMFSIPPVSGGAAAPHLDFHLDTHQIVKETDYGKQEEAREASKHDTPKISTDRDGQTHIYEAGNELASNDRSGSSSHDNSSYDSYDRSETT